MEEFKPPTAKKLITERFDIPFDVLEGPVENVLAALRDKADSLMVHRNKQFVIVYGYDGPEELAIQAERFETDLEFSERVEALKKQWEARRRRAQARKEKIEAVARATEEAELKELARLQQKYGVMEGEIVDPGSV